MSVNCIQLPRLSLIVATADRVTELQRLLLSLLECDLQGVEVIIVDQNSDDRLYPLLSSMSSRLTLRWIRQPERNVSLARNNGVSYATGEWLGFPDDDCAFLPGTLTAIREAITTGDVDVLTGMTRDSDAHPSVLRWHPSQAAITPGLLRSTFAESTLYLRRDLFCSVDGFDQAFGPGARFAAEEGIDLIRRLWRRHPGVRMLYSPQICFYHRHQLAYADERAVRKSWSYAHARGAMFARHWRMASIPRALNEVARHLIGSVLFSGLRRRTRLAALAALASGFLAYHLWRFRTWLAQASMTFVNE